jgi:hypothetical protein
MILSLSIFPFIARNLAGKALDIGYDEAGLQRMSDQVAQLLERGFKP